MNIAELRPYAKKVDLAAAIVLEKREVREVSSKLDNSTHRVSEALIADSTGSVLLTIWDDLIEKIEEGKAYKITNGYTSLFKNSLRLNVGRYGSLEESKEKIDAPNKENNLSEKEF